MSASASTDSGRSFPPLRYHRLLLALPSYRWWKPLVALVLAFVYWVIFQTVWTVIFVVVGFATGELPFSTDVAELTTALLRFLSIDAAKPLSIAAGLGGVVTLLPAVLLAYLSVGLRPLSVLRSIAFRMRWGWLALCLLPAVAITLVATALGAWVLPAAGIGSYPSAATVPLTTFLICVLLFVILTPFQAAAEEFAFRGLASQMVGGWVRPAWVAILASSVLFAASHSQYIGWATLSVGLFGVVAGVVTWRTGGLEAAIALHAANNTIAFVAQATGALGPTQAFDPTKPAGDGPSDYWLLIVAIVTQGAYVLIVHLMAKRRGIQASLEPNATRVPSVGIPSALPG